MKERYHVTFSSWDYDLSSCIQELFKEMELAKRKRPVMDVLFQFLSKRVQLDFCYFLVVWSGMVCRRSRGRRGRTEIYILRWLFDGIHNGYSHGYCFMIQDTESSADIICFKPDPVIGNVEKMYTEERSLPPATCKVRILDRKLSTDMQKEVVDVSVSE